MPLKKYLSVFAEIFDDLNSRAAAAGAGGAGDKVDVSPSVQQIALAVAETQIRDFTAVNITEIDFVLLSTFTIYFLYLCENEVRVDDLVCITSGGFHFQRPSCPN